MAVKERPGSIAILVAVRREAEAVLKVLSFLKPDPVQGQNTYRGRWRGRNIILRVLGMGPENAKRGVEVLIQAEPLSLMIVLGFAGALQPQLKTGTLILAEEIRYDNKAEPVFVCNPDLLGISDRALNETGIPVHKGKIVTVSSPLCSFEKKMEAGRPEPFLAVDMESAVLAEGAEAKRVPFLCFRAILDEVQDHIRVNPERISKEGKLSALRILKTLTLDPGSVFDIIRLTYLRNAAGRSMQRAIMPVLRGIFGEE